MIEVDITEEMRTLAREKAEKLGVLKNSVTRGHGNLVGQLGELCAQKALGGELQSTADYDLVLSDGTKIDVKSKGCGYQPQPHFEVSISAFNTRQACDKYVFVSVQKDHKKAWVLGEMPKAEFFERAYLIRQGQFDPRNQWRCPADQYNLAIAELKEVVTPSDSGTADA